MQLHLYQLQKCAREWSNQMEPIRNSYASNDWIFVGMILLNLWNLFTANLIRFDLNVFLKSMLRLFQIVKLQLMRTTKLIKTVRWNSSPGLNDSISSLNIPRNGQTYLKEYHRTEWTLWYEPVRFYLSWISYLWSGWEQLKRNLGTVRVSYWCISQCQFPCNWEILHSFNLSDLSSRGSDSPKFLLIMKMLT